MEPGIIFEDDNILVLDKPAGLVVHGDGRTKEGTLADWILEHYPALRDVGEPFTPWSRMSHGDATGDFFRRSEPGEHSAEGVAASLPRPGIVHRLDRDTSGVMVIAKNPQSFDFLKSAFKNHQVKKEYLALVYGHLPTESGVIDMPIGKSKKDFRQREAGPLSGGTQREARTVWEVKQRFVDGAGHKYSLLYVRPETGRTHQIRAHMKSLGYPVSCDSLYAHGRLCPVPLARHALHAQKLTLPLPDGSTRTFESPLPEDFRAALHNLSAV